MQSSVVLLEPIHDARLESIRASRVIAMDETPIKAGQAGAGKMKAAYFWPVYGEQDEICFLYYLSRSGRKMHSDCHHPRARYCKPMGTRSMRSMRKRPDCNSGH
jgi:hypothetical protein